MSTPPLIILYPIFAPYDDLWKSFEKSLSLQHVICDMQLLASQILLNMKMERIMWWSYWECFELTTIFFKSSCGVTFSLKMPQSVCFDFLVVTYKHASLALWLKFLPRLIFKVYGQISQCKKLSNGSHQVSSHTKAQMVFPQLGFYSCDYKYQ